MRKKVTLSLVALTSVSMAAYADANVSSLLSSGDTSWSTETGTGFSYLGNYIWSSANGADLSQTIGELVPGTYKLVAGTQENAELWVNGKKLLSDGLFTMTETGSVTFTVKSKSGGPFTVGGFVLTLVYDFSDYPDLYARLTVAINPLKEVDQKLLDGVGIAQQLLSETSAMMKELETLKDATGDESENLNAYNVYKKYELYNGTGVILEKIAWYQDRVNTVATGLSSFDELLAKYVVVNGKLTPAADADAETISGLKYAKSLYGGELDNISKAISDQIENIEDLDDNAIETFKNEKNERLNEISEAIDKAVTDDKCYHEVENQIASAIATANTTLTEIKGHYDVTPGTSADTYKDLYDKAQAEINEQIAALQKLRGEELNGTAKSHNNAGSKYDENLAAISKIVDEGGELQRILSNNKTLAETLKAAYTNANTEVKAIEDDLKETKSLIEGAELTGDELTKAIEAADKAVTALRDAVEKENTEHTIADYIDQANDKSNYAELKTAAQNACDKLEEVAGEGIANYKAYLDIKNGVTNTSLTGLQNVFDKTKKTVNAYNSKKADNTYSDYSVNGKYTGWEQSIQDAIDAYLEGAEAAYKAGTAVAYKEEQANKEYNVGTEEAPVPITGTVAKINADITTYQTKAKEALDNYKTEAPELAALKKAYDELVETVDDNSVTFMKDGKETSYRKEMAAIKNEITTLETTFTNAQTMTDDKHYEEMMKFVVDADITAEITGEEGLIKKYAERKSEYLSQTKITAAWIAFQNATSAINTLRDEIEAEIAKITGKAGNSEKALLEALGIDESGNETGLLEKLTEKEGEYNPYGLDVNDKAGTIGNITTSNASTIFAEMNDVVDYVNDLREEFDACKENDKKATDKVKAENLAKTEIDQKIGLGSYATYDGTICAIIRSAEKQHTDAAAKDCTVLDGETYSKSADYNSDYSELTSKLTTIESLITALRNDEQLSDAKDAAFEYPAGTKYEKGIMGMLDEYEALANKLLQQATNEADSWTEYIKRVDYYKTVESYPYGYEPTGDADYDADYVKKGVSEALQQAGTDIDEVTEDGKEGEKYYESLLTKYTGKATTLFGQIKSAYESYKNQPADDKSMKSEFEATTTTYTTNIKDLVDDITALAGDAYNNEMAYQGRTDSDSERTGVALVSVAEEVRTYWTEVNELINNEDESTKKEENLKTLRALQNQLNELDAEVLKGYSKGNYSEGTAGDAYTKSTGDYSTIRSAIEAIKNWKDGSYDNQIIADNLNTYKAFLDEIAEAETRYNEVKNNIGKITNTSAVIKDVAQDVLDKNGGLADYAEIFRKVRVSVQDKYNETSAPTVFTPYPYVVDGNESTDDETVAAYVEDINDLYEELLTAAYGAATSALSTVTQTAEDKLDDAISEVEGYGITLTKTVGTENVTINPAFVELQEILAKAQGSLTVDELTYIISADEWIKILGTGLDGMIAEAKEQAAVNDWNLLKTKVDAIIAEELAALDEYIAKGYATEEDKENYISIKETYYNDGDDTTDEDAVSMAEKAIAAGNLYYEELQEVKNLVKQFQDNNGYSDAANESAYNDFMADIETFENGAFAELQAYAEGYFIHDSYESVINNVKDGIEALKAKAYDWWKHNENYPKTVAEYYADENNAITKGIELITTGEGIIQSTDNAILGGVFTISYAKTMLDGYENAALAGVVRTLDALNNEINIDENLSYPGFEDKKDGYNHYDGAIDGFTTTVASIAANTEEGYDKHAAYIALEKEVAKVQEELEAIKDAGVVAAAETALTNALAPVKTKYAEVETALNECNVNVVNAFTSELEGLNTELGNIESGIASNKAEGTLLFYKDNLAEDIENADAALDALKKQFENAQKPYTAHDAKYAELSEDLEEIKTRFETLQTTLKSYREEVGSNETIFKQAKTISDNLVSVTNILEECAAAAAEGGNAADLLKASSTDESVFGYAVNIATITNSVDVFERNISYYQYYLEINSNVDGLSTLLSTANALITANNYKFAPEVDEEINITYESIEASINSLNSYNNEFYKENREWIYDRWTVGRNILETASVEKDVYGAWINEETHEGVVVDYMEEAVPAIKARIETLKTDIENYKNSIEENSYVLGDLTGDKQVTDADYLQLLYIILHPETAPEEGSLIAYGGDINGDGQFNTSDLVSLVQIMNGRYTSQNRANACMAPTVLNDAIAFEAVGEGANQRIAIRLNNSQAYVGCQMDIKLPAGLTLEGESVGDRAETHSLSSNDLANGMHRIVLSSLDNVEFTDGEALVYLDVLVGHSYNGAGIEVSNILFVDANTRAYKFADLKGNEATGIDTVTFGEAVKGKVYSVGGKLMNGMKRGINIIRGNDGSTKKVIVK